LQNWDALDIARTPYTTEKPYSINETQETNVSLRKPMPGVIIHAHMLSQILSATDKPPITAFPQEIEVLWLWICALGGGMLVGRSRKVLRLVIVATPVSFFWLWLCYAAINQATWFPVISPCLAFILAGVVVIYINWNAFRKQL